MAEWPTVTIGDLITDDGGEIKTGPFGTKLKAAEYSDDGVGVPLISVREIGYGRIELDSRTPRVPREVQERLPEFILREGDIVFGRKGAVDRSAFVTHEQDGWFLGSDGIRLRLSTQECEPRFLAYQLQTRALQNWILRHAGGTTMASLNQRVVARIPIKLPPLPTQCAIVRVLSSLDDKIELNRKMNRTLEYLAQAIFRSWFVNFDPVVVKADSRKPYGMTDEIAALFPDRFADSELGAIPKGWAVATISDGFKRHRNMVKPSEHPDELFHYYSIPNFDSGRQPTGEKGSQIGSAKHLVTDGSILISKLNPDIPRVWLPQPEGQLRRICSTEFLVCEPLPPLGVPFAYCLFSDPAFRRDLVSLITGTSKSHQRVRTSDFERMKFVVPPTRLLDVFNNVTSPAVEKTVQSRIESQTLADLRDTLLPMLLSQEIRVIEAEKVIATDV